MLALFDLANQLLRRGERIAGKGGLTTQQWMLLLSIAGDPHFPNGSTRRARLDAPLASGIAEARGVSRANISVLLSELLLRRLVRRVPMSDRRHQGLVITAAGRRALQRIEPTRRRANRLLVARLSRRRRREFLSDLRACLETVLKEREEAYL